MFSYIEKQLKENGWEPIYDPAVDVWGIDVYGRDGKTVVTVGMGWPMSSDNADIFEKLRDLIADRQHPVGIIFKGGGSVDIPDWFMKFCEDNGVRIHVLTDDDTLPREMCQRNEM